MNPTVWVDTKEFDQAVKECIAATNRTAAEVVNGQALALASNAYKMTHHANPERIRNELGQTGWKLTKTIVKPKWEGTYKSFFVVAKGKHAGRRAFLRRRTGRGGIILGSIEKRRKGRGVKARRRTVEAAEGTLAFRIVCKRLIAKGTLKPNRSGPSYKELVDMAKRLIAARAMSANYVRSGWLWSMDTLWRRVRGKDKWGATGWQRGEAKRAAWNSKRVRGYAAPANVANKNWDKPTAIIANASIGERRGVQMAESEKYKVAEDGLKKAITYTIADMRRHLQTKLQSALRKHSAHGR